tara:strand:+ start:1636 stop:2031 length:396 start_codon:yes stop_codon:yes gene_type:complete
MTADGGPFYHASEGPLDRENLKPFLHVGTLEQAKMRRHKGIIHRIEIKQSQRITTMKDTGAWTVSRLKKAARRAPLARYLNRFEGIEVDDLVEAALYADVSDSLFQKKVPSAQASWIILDPSIIRSITIHN